MTRHKIHTQYEWDRGCRMSCVITQHHCLWLWLWLSTIICQSMFVVARPFAFSLPFYFTTITTRKLAILTVDFHPLVEYNFVYSLRRTLKRFATCALSIVVHYQSPSPLSQRTQINYESYCTVVIHWEHEAAADVLDLFNISNKLHILLVFYHEKPQFWYFIKLYRNKRRKMDDNLHSSSNWFHSERQKACDKRHYIQRWYLLWYRIIVYPKSCWNRFGCRWLPILLPCMSLNHPSNNECSLLVAKRYDDDNF